MLKNKRFLLTILVALLILLVPSIVKATEINENSGNNNLPKFTDFSNAKFEIIQYDEDSSTGWVALKINGIDEKTIFDFGETYNLWGYYYFVTPDNTKPELTFLQDGRIKSINGEENLESYLVAPASVYDEEQDCILLYDMRFVSSLRKYN